MRFIQCARLQLQSTQPNFNWLKWARHVTGIYLYIHHYCWTNNLHCHFPLNVCVFSINAITAQVANYTICAPFVFRITAVNQDRLTFYHTLYYPGFQSNQHWFDYIRFAFMLYKNISPLFKLHLFSPEMEAAQQVAITVAMGIYTDQPQH